MNTAQSLKRAIGATLVAGAILSSTTTAWAEPKITAVQVTQTSPSPTPAGSNAVYQLVVTHGTGATITGDLLQTNSLPAGVTVSFVPPSLTLPNGVNLITGSMVVAVSPTVGTTNIALCVRCENSAQPSDFAIDCAGSLSSVSTSLPSCSVSGPSTACPNASGLTYTDTTDALTPRFSWSVTGNGSISGPATNASVTVSAGAAGSFTAACTITDLASGKSNICSQVVSVSDTNAPTITTCATNQFGSANGSCQASVPNFTNGVVASDNCSTVSISQSPTIGTLAGIGSNTVTISVADLNGNTNTCTAAFILSDTAVPSITCPGNVSINADLGQCFASGVSLGSPATSDNCGVASVTSNAPANFPVGSTFVTWTVVDIHGNSNTCQQTVTVVDNQNPTITCPAPVTANTDLAACSASGVSLGSPVTADNCGVAAVTNNAPASIPLGTNTVTWTVTDNSGNTATCDQTVIVADNRPPTITCPATVTVNIDLAVCSASGVSLGSPTTFDNCGVASVTNNAPASFPIGTNSVTWTVTDTHGNAATCNQLVVVVDNQPPAITCPVNVSVNADPGQCSATGVVLGSPVTSDNCGVASVTNNAPASFPVGTNTVTWTVTDNSGNTATCQQSVTVADNQAPSITCPADVSLVAGPGQCTVSNVNLGATTAGDNCGIASVTSNAPASFPAGITLVTWTATDVNGNSATCTQTVTILDQELPSITCPTNISVFIDVGQCTASNVNLGTPVVTDNCTAAFTNNAPALFPIGTNTVTWTATDPAGNSNTCQQTVVVIDPVVPVAVGTNITASLGANGQAVVLGSQLNGGSTDNCGITGQLIGGTSSNVFTCADLGTNFVNYIVTDQSGNSATTSVTVVIADTTPPTIVCTNVTVALGTNGSVVVNGSQLDGGSTDNCGVSGQLINGGSSQTFTAADLGTNSTQFIASDASGNSSTCTATVVVIDTTPPTITCPGNVNVGTSVGLCGATGVALGSPTASDNAGIASVTNNAPATFPVGTTNVTWIAIDTSGNSVTCQQSVTVTDTQAPTVTSCPANVNVNTDTNQCTASGVALGTPPTATDACDPGPFTVTNNAPATFPVGATTVTWTIADSSGNAATCTQTVTVTDNQLPSITCPATVNTTTDPNLTTASNVNLGTPTTSDNCSVASVTNNAPSLFPAGTNLVTWTVTDAQGNSATCQQTVNVAQGNRPPTVVNQTPTVNEGGSLSVAAPGVLAGASDPDGDPITAFLVSAPSNGVAQVSTNGSYSYTPNANFVGIDCFSYAATDGIATSAVATVCVSVGVANQAPVANNDSYTTAEDTTLNVSAPGVLGNDTDADTNALTAVLVSTTSHGTLTLSANGSFSYVPATNYNGPDSFTYKANDGFADSAAATVSLTVTPVNDPPTVVNQTPSMSEDGSLSVGAPGVLAGASDPDGDPITAILITPPSNGTAVVNPNGSYSYTPDANFNGTNCFTYAATDGTTTSTPAQVCVTVNAVNDAPVANNNSYSVISNTTLNVSAPGVLGNDTDVDSDTLTATQVTGPTNGTLTLSTDGSFSYTPDTDYIGPDSFTYTANDGTVDSGIATVTINVTAANTAPVANADAYSIGEDDFIDVVAPGVLANDTDTESDTLTAILVSTTTSGTLTLNSNGAFSYVPNDNFNGTDSFTYRASDTSLTSGVATVTLTVSAVNGAGDIDLYAKSQSFKVNWATTGHDQFKIKGKINPRGANVDLAGATMQISVNGTNIFAPVTLDSVGNGAATVGSTKIKAKLNSATGVYSYTISGLDLRNIIGLPNTTGTGLTSLDVKLIIAFADLQVTPIRGTLENSFKTTAGKTSSGKFAFKKNRTLTGAFNWNKTTAAQATDGSFKVTGKGVAENEGGSGIAPTGNIRVTIGGSVFTIPATGVKFGLNGTSRTFKISASGLTATGIPLASATAPTVYELGIMFEVPVTGGTNIFETIIELKRPTGTSTKWKR